MVRYRHRAEKDNYFQSRASQPGFSHRRTRMFYESSDADWRTRRHTRFIG